MRSITQLQQAPKEIEDLAGCEIYLKREDLSPAGSFKIRSLTHQIAHYYRKGYREVIVPTSGNAGIAACIAAKKKGVKVHVFMHPSIDEAKLAVLKKHGAYLYISYDSLKQAKLLSARKSIPNLRSSTDDTSIEGYRSLAVELSSQLPDCDAVFTYVTSGSSIVGMGRMYRELCAEKMPSLHAVQSGDIASVAEAFGQVSKHEEQKAGKGGIKNTRRKEQILEVIRHSQGSGWFISNKEMENAKDMLKKHSIHASLEGCASLAAAIKTAKERGYKKVVVIISGKDWSACL